MAAAAGAGCDRAAGEEGHRVGMRRCTAPCAALPHAAPLHAATLRDATLPMHSCMIRRCGTVRCMVAYCTTTPMHGCMLHHCMAAPLFATCSTLHCCAAACQDGPHLPPALKPATKVISCSSTPHQEHYPLIAAFIQTYSVYLTIMSVLDM